MMKKILLTVLFIFAAWSAPAWAADKGNIDIADSGTITQSIVNAALIGVSASDAYTVTFSGGPTAIGDYAFHGCAGLVGVAIPGSVTTIDFRAFNGCTNLTTLDLSNASKLETIGNNAFDGCAGLTGVAIPGSVTAIGDYVFYNCTGLDTLDLSNASSLETIGNEAFYGCASLTGVTITGNVTTIGVGAFNGCASLDTLTFLGDSPPSFGDSVFIRVPGPVTVYVPAGKEGSYAGLLSLLPADSMIVDPAPAITGPEDMTLTVGYAAASTGAYTVKGAPPPTTKQR